MVYKGSYYDDGILKVVLKTKKDMGFNLTVFNVHTSGGTFGKSKEVVKRKQQGRVKELKLLNTAIKKTTQKNILIMGDFNLDSNDMKKYPELKLSPEYKDKKIYDIRRLFKPKLSGATEDELVNTFRSSMKIKPMGERRKARYDKILYKGVHISPTKIKLIGNKKINKRVQILGKTKTGEKKKRICYLFPSDHFGIFTQFEIIKNS